MLGGQERRAENQERRTAEFHGLQVDEIKQGIRARKAEAKRARMLEEATATYFGLNKAPDPEAAEQQFMGLGKVGRDTLKEIKEFEKAGRDEATAELQQWAPAIMEMEPGPEREQADIWLARKMQDAGAIGEGVARAYLNAAPEERDRMLRAAAGGETERISGDFVVYDKPDGTQILMNEADPRDQEVLRQNRDWVKAATKTEVRTGEITKSEATKLRDYESATRSFINRGQDILELLEENPDANTVVSVIEKAGMNLVAEARQIAKDAGFSSVEDEIEDFDRDGTNSFLQEKGIASARMRGQVVALAYMWAKILGRGDRVSNDDFKFSLESLGASNSDPKAFASALRDHMKAAERDFLQDYEARKGEPYEGSFGLAEPEIPTFTEETVEEGYANLPSGAEFIGPDGIRRVKP